MPRLTERYTLVLTPKDRALLDKIAEQEERSPADILRTFIRREAAARKIKDTSVQPNA